MPGCQTPQVFKEYFILKMEEGLGEGSWEFCTTIKLGRREFYTRLEERDSHKKMGKVLHKMGGENSTQDWRREIRTRKWEKVLDEMGRENSTQDRRREYCTRWEERILREIREERILQDKNSARWQERFYTIREESIVHETGGGNATWGEERIFNTRWEERGQCKVGERSMQGRREVNAR